MTAVQSFKVRSLAPNKVSITKSIDLHMMSVRDPAKYAVRDKCFLPSEFLFIRRKFVPWFWDNSVLNDDVRAML